MTIDIKTTTLKDALKAAQAAGCEYVMVPGAGISFCIGDFLDELTQDDTATDYVRMNGFIFRLNDIGSTDADLYELS